MAGLGRWLSYSVRRAGLDRDLAQAVPYLHGRVLEIGCGRDGRRGEFQPPVHQCVSWVTLDRRSRGRPHLLGDVQCLPCRDHAVDAVVCLEVLEYVDDPERALREIHRVLTPSGHLVLAAPFLHRADTADDYWRFTEPGLRRLLGRAGFDVVRLSAQGAALGVATNILKYAVASQPGWRRRLLGLTARPALSLLWRLDRPSARRQPVLATFSTGYLAVARPQGTLPGGPA